MQHVQREILEQESCRLLSIRTGGAQGKTQRPLITHAALQPRVKSPTPDIQERLLANSMLTGEDWKS